MSTAARPPRPVPLQGDLRNLPNALAPLKELPNWVCWRWEWRIDKKGVGKWTKPPFQPKNPQQYAKNNDPSTWGTYKQALAAFEAGQCDGIGFCLLGTDLASFDLDNSRDPATGDIAPDAMAYVDRAASYTEISVSGTGLHVIGYGLGLKMHRKQKVPGSAVEVESYRGAERYIVVTGNPLPGILDKWPHMVDIGDKIDAVVAELDGHKDKAQQDLADEFAAEPQSQGSTGADTGDTFLPGDLIELIEKGVPPDRDLSAAFHRVVCGLGDLGWSAERIEARIAGKPIVPERFAKRLAKEIARSLSKRKPGPNGQEAAGATASATNPPPRKSLAEVHAVFKKWFGAEYDLDAATASMAAAASERLPGDPLWLLIVAGPGGAKTETVQALAGCGAHITSTISSEGALLSATPTKQKSKKATGGLLRKIGDHGTLVIKDFTSILSADRNTRASVLAAIREVYDGRWERNVGTDGGQTLTWTGRIVIVAAVTTAWDAAHAVVATMGDRFALLRLRTGDGRQRAGRGAIRNTGDEVAMRQELAGAVGALIAHMDPAPYQLSDDEVEQVVKAADLVTLARSAVERDYRGEIEFAHDPEAPTRFAKQLVQLLRGAVSIGVSPAEAMRLVRRCACDSIPPLRRDILLDLAENPGSRATDVRKRISQPRNTVRRGLECLHMLGTLVCDETEETDRNGRERTISRYRLADGLDRETLQSVIGHK